MTASPRGRELEAIATLVHLHSADGPDEWKPEHHAAADAAAFVAAEFLRRSAKHVAANRARSDRQKADGATNTKKRNPDEGLAEAHKVVKARSGGVCEARTPWCEGKATQAHHKGGRTDHRPGSLLDVCGQGNASGCHGYIHQNPDESYAAGWMTKRLGPVTPHVRDEPARAGSQDRETPE